ncbi:MFS transporter [Streptomyces sp. NBC_01618]|uniref:MFS transporter n=1 Tax=Streptomyces sp. NBC_01618 TaxID=2975900 RepID=UPI0038657F7E|nr:MFS transporter [Streptomyces sp. NBC_01618]
MTTSVGAAAPPAERRSRVRWVMIWLAFAGLTIAYVDRANISVALPYMTKDLHIDPALSGLLLGAFFWTYSLFQIPMGWLVDRFGSRVLYAAAVAWWSLITFAMAAVRGVGSLIGARLLLGVGEAAAFPACTKVVERWFPRQERGTASGIYDSGARGGTLLATPLVTALIAAVGWRGSFIVTGVLGMIWVVFWLKMYRDPRKHPKVNEAELAYIEAGQKKQDADASDDGPQLRWRDLLRYRTVWGMALGFSCQSFVIYFFITWFPSYLVEARGFSLLTLGVFGTIPAIIAFIGNFGGGWASDALVRRGHSLTFARKSCIIAGMLVSALIGLAAVVDNSMVALALLSLSFGGVTFATSSIVTLPADIAPLSTRSWASTIQGVQNSVSNLAGVASPFVIGLIYSSTGSFVGGLLAAAGVAIAGCLIYLFMVGDIKPLEVKARPDATAEPVR